jgi:hypothetical protein
MSVRCQLIQPVNLEALRVGRGAAACVLAHTQSFSAPCYVVFRVVYMRRLLALACGRVSVAWLSAGATWQ